MAHHKVLIVGGGSAGVTVAAMLRNLPEPLGVTIIEPRTEHYYQPLWTLVGGGVFPKEESMRQLADYIPDGAQWIQDKVQAFDPDNKKVILASGAEHTYDILVVAAGLQLDWAKIKGLEGNLGKNGLVSNYTYETVESTWEALRNLNGGNAVFSYPNTPIKCAGAPQKIMYLTEHHLRRKGRRNDVNVIYASATPSIFGVDKYRRSLEKIVSERNIQTHFGVNLVEVRPQAREAVFERLGGGDPLVLPYTMLHVVPPMSAPEFIKKSPLADNTPLGYVDIDKHTMQHVRYPDVFSLGDAGSSPNSKTAAAIRKQAPVVVENILCHLQKRPLTASYDGYASCPLVTGYGRLLMAEFIYGGIPKETLPYDQSKERYSLYALKAYGLPRMYWHGMLRGRW